uniref:Uncharacterized protein n=1 Tax=Chromera velia CCMP2878 TaxID=1169474 RepID=A0A0G4HCF3_9ALVE|eukprot:Cvel_26188.t1-p1 / transcript=Cvel_26188.t1 / gene=Cvel_26188 / organism=Chromera_velia_CCMP2878 / gene_product=hypothetical protein / transcript_product=hypothetical protein / location=Cvel_scaffold3080:9243-14139(-) / protein_length=415 / sequence_SO=supercontig / SO=protein_coding / is_pseudo=false
MEAPTAILQKQMDTQKQSHDQTAENQRKGAVMYRKKIPPVLFTRDYYVPEAPRRPAETKADEAGARREISAGASSEATRVPSDPSSSLSLPLPHQVSVSGDSSVSGLPSPAERAPEGAVGVHAGALKRELSSNGCTETGVGKTGHEGEVEAEAEGQTEEEAERFDKEKAVREAWYLAELSDTRTHIDAAEQDRIRVGPPVWVIAVITALRELYISPFVLATRMRGSQKNSNRIQLRVVKDKKEGRYSLGKDDGTHRPQLAWKVVAERGEQHMEVYVVCFLTASDLQSILDVVEKATSSGLKEGLLPPANSESREDKRKKSDPASQKLLAKIVKMCRSHPIVSREREYNEMLARVEARVLNPTDWAKYINFTHLGPVHTRNRQPGGTGGQKAQGRKKEHVFDGRNQGALGEGLPQT